MATVIANNVVRGSKLRLIQAKTLNELAEILKNSFGPNGSNACIKKENALSRYTKDGHTIVGALHYNGIIEQSIKDDVESITRYIVKTVGDGTTSAVIMSSNIFGKIVALEGKYKPVQIVEALNYVVDRIKTRIKETANGMTLEEVYDIAMISTNGNTFISQTLRDIYQQYGNEVFIDVTPSTNEEFVIKSYDGMTINAGYHDSCYVTNTKNNTSEVDHPEIYFFEHPIDTRELGVFFDAIVSKNIIQPFNSRNFDSIVPTVIFAPTIGQDCTSTLDSLVSVLANMPVNNKLPICIISGYNDIEPLMDLVKLCGAKTIRKYIDPSIYMEDVKNGNAPTPDTIADWAGTADKVIAHSEKTVFMRPSKMFNEDDSYTDLYKNLVNFLEMEIKKATDDGEDGLHIGRLKKRLYSLKSNMVELFVGGITQADRDSLRDLVEDAVLNIRSASKNGVGYAANLSGAHAAHDEYMYWNVSEESNSLELEISRFILEAYREIVESLYSGTKIIETFDNYDGNLFYSILKKKVTDGTSYNIRTESWENNVKTSIMSDITILDTVCKIIGIMATANQFIVPTAMHNIYEDFSSK